MNIISPMSFSQYFDLLPSQIAFLDDVVAGLNSNPKQIAPKYFYDKRGCSLFEDICNLPEYYPTRTELSIMAENATTMADWIGKGGTLIEIGCGNSHKSRLLLEELQPTEFVALDIAVEQLKSSCDALAQEFPKIKIVALRADFEEAPAIPEEAGISAAPRVLYFPGSTIGNFTPTAAREFLSRWAPVLGAGSYALIGVDMKKDRALLEAAYNDANGVTAAFNQNLLSRLNRELGADFDETAFRHWAFYNVEEGRIEMHLKSLCPQIVSLGGARIEFSANETIRTEISCKYSIAEFQELGRAAGYLPQTFWTDSKNMFAVHLFKLPPNLASS
jgi:dimethylhistidine N-methyltransferase